MNQATYKMQQVKVPTYTPITKYFQKDPLRSHPIFERPDHNIVHTEQSSNYLSNVFELTVKDLEFLESHNKSSEEENFKKMISILEDEAHLKPSGKVAYSQVGDKFRTVFPNFKPSFFHKVYNYWKEERKIRKRSFLRKYWKKNLLEDKYLEFTFTGEDNEQREKENESTVSLLRKKRMYSQPLEILQKLMEVKLEIEELLSPILSMMRNKEKLKLEELILERRNFEIVNVILSERYKIVKEDEKKNKKIEVKNCEKENKENVAKKNDLLEEHETAQSMNDDNYSVSQKIQPVEVKVPKKRGRKPKNWNKELGRVVDPSELKSIEEKPVIEKPIEELKTPQRKERATRLQEKPEFKEVSVEKSISVAKDENPSLCSTPALSKGPGKSNIISSSFILNIVKKRVSEFEDGAPVVGKKYKFKKEESLEKPKKKKYNNVNEEKEEKSFDQRNNNNEDQKIIEENNFPEKLEDLNGDSFTIVIEKSAVLPFLNPESTEISEDSNNINERFDRSMSLSHNDEKSFSKHNSSFEESKNFRQSTLIEWKKKLTREEKTQKFN